MLKLVNIQILSSVLMEKYLAAKIACNAIITRKAAPL